MKPADIFHGAAQKKKKRRTAKAVRRNLADSIAFIY